MSLLLTGAGPSGSTAANPADATLRALTAGGTDVLISALKDLANGVTDCIVVATPTNPAATVTINGTPGSTLDVTGLTTGDNVVTIVVTAADKVTTQTFNLNLHVLTAGTANVTQIETTGTTGAGVSGKVMTIYDAAGSVGLWFNAGAAGAQMVLHLDGTAFAALIAAPGVSPVYLFTGPFGSGSLQFYFDPANMGGQPGVPLTNGDLNGTVAELGAALASAGIGVACAADGNVLTITGTAPGAGSALTLATPDLLLIMDSYARGADAPAAPGGFHRTLETDVLPADTDSALQSKLITALAADAAWSTTNLGGNVLAVTDAAIGARTAADAGNTGLTVTTPTPGADPA
jgi:cadherin-like protein